MKYFDPMHIRRRILGRGEYERALQSPHDEAQEFAGLASSARAFSNYAAEAVLLGLFDSARQLLVKARDWVADAIDTDERPNNYIEFGDEALRFYTLAWCNFLLTGEHDSESWRQYYEFHAAYLTDPSSAHDRTEVSLFLPHYLAGGAYERALEIFAACPKLKPPETLSKIRGEAQMCYVIARQRLGLEYSQEEVQDAIGRFLKRNVESAWLSDGHSIRAAEWMKIAHWRPGLDPFATVLKAYDYLPDVTPPSEVLEYRRAHPLP